MRIEFLRLIRLARPALLVAGAAMLAACSAQTSPFRGAAKAVNFATDTPEPAAFVGATRRSEADYIRIERELPARPSQPRTAEQVKALESSMEATRSRNAAQGAAAQAEGRTPPPTPPKAPPPEPAE